MFEIREIFAYAHSVRRKFAEKMAALEWEEVVANREASHHSMKNILIHMIDNEDWMLDGNIKGNKAHVRSRPEEFRTMQSILEFMKGVEERTEAFLATASENDLRSRVVVTFGQSGNTITMTAEEWLMQSFTEQMFHLGEIEALMWQKDIEPPRMQWFANNPRASESSSPATGARKM